MIFFSDFIVAKSDHRSNTRGMGRVRERSVGPTMARPADRSHHHHGRGLRQPQLGQRGAPHSFGVYTGAPGGPPGGRWQAWWFFTILKILN